MAKQVGTFVPDDHLRTRDNSGGPKGPHTISEWGSGGKPVGGEVSGDNERTGMDDEFKAPPRGAGNSSRGY